MIYSTLKMEAVYSSETLSYSQYTTLRYNREGYHVYEVIDGRGNYYASPTIWNTFNTGRL
jgi:hypothetical protein